MRTRAIMALLVTMAATAGCAAGDKRTPGSGADAVDASGSGGGNQLGHPDGGPSPSGPPGPRVIDAAATTDVVDAPLLPASPDPGDDAAVETDAQAGGAAPPSKTPPAGAGPLTIYFVDVEGGAATLLISPDGVTLLADAGFPAQGDRDPKRIEAALMLATGDRKLNYMLTTHYDTDHVGGVPGVASRLEVGTLLDHGDSTRQNSYWTAYQGIAKPRKTIRAGDTLALGEHVTLHFVSARGTFIKSPLPGAADEPNPACRGRTPPAKTNDENAMSIGFVARFGLFDFLDLADLNLDGEHELACPVNLVGKVDVYQVTHHGLARSGAAELVHAVAPLVAVMNNGATKGGEAPIFDSLFASPGLEDVWQGHRAVRNDAAHNAPDDFIANPQASPDAGHWLRLVAHPNGRYTVTNGRNDFSKTYQAR